MLRLALTRHITVPARGVQDSQSQTGTRALGGCFLEDSALRQEFISVRSSLNRRSLCSVSLDQTQSAFLLTDAGSFCFHPVRLFGLHRAGSP